MISTLINDPQFWILAVLGVFLTGISKSGFAGGAGVVAVPLLALVIPPTVALVLVLPLLLMMDAQTIGIHRRRLQLRELKIIVPAALVGVAAGTYLLSGISERVLQLMLGLISLAFAAMHVLRPHPALPQSAAWPLGALAGTTSTLIHAGGPPLNIYLASRGLPRDVWISTAAVFFASVNLAKVGAYAAINLWQWDLLLVTLALAPIAIIGVYTGHRIQLLMSEALFVRMVMLCLAITGLLLTAKALI